MGGKGGISDATNISLTGSRTITGNGSTININDKTKITGGLEVDEINGVAGMDLEQKVITNLGDMHLSIIDALIKLEYNYRTLKFKRGLLQDAGATQNGTAQ